MSLRVWLPLNGNLNNQGLSDVVLNSGGITYTDGKIGQAANFSSSYIGITNTPITGSIDNFSFCFWLKTSSPSSTMCLYNGRTSIGGPCGIFIISGHLRFDDGNLHDLTYEIPSDVWEHYTITRNTSNIKLYVNGELIYTTASTAFTCTATQATIGVSSTNTSTGNGSNYFIGQLNDYRIYDHCLSPKEVAEIAKGLCLHYPLNNIYNCQSNKYSSPYCDGYMSYIGGFTRTALTDERGYNYKMTYTGTGNNSWKSLRVPTYSFTVGKTYYYSVKIRCNKWTADTLYLRASRSENDWATRYIAVCSTSLADGKWHEYYTYQTVNETYDRSGTTVTSNPVLEFYTGACVTDGFVYDFDFDIKDVQVVESNEYVPFQQGEWNTNVISDCSGFSNDGIKTGSINWNGDTSRYSGSYEFNGTDTSIKNNSDAWHGGTINDKTISCWIKPSGSACGGAGGIMAESASGTIMSMYNSVWQFANGSSWVNYSNGGITVGEWSHHACTIKDGVIKIYKNGSLISTNTNTSILTTLSSSNYVAVGCDFPGGDEYFNGLISDFRIYATALSDADILELYNTPINIDNKGNLYAYEFIEEDKNNFSKQGIAKNSDFIDLDTAGDSYTNASISSTVDYANIFIEK